MKRNCCYRTSFFYLIVEVKRVLEERGQFYPTPSYKHFLTRLSPKAEIPGHLSLVYMLLKSSQTQPGKTAPSLFLYSLFREMNGLGYDVNEWMLFIQYSLIDLSSDKVKSDWWKCSRVVKKNGKMSTEHWTLCH